MKRIGLVVGRKLPVPDVRGGAIEKLVQILAEENEQYQEVEFYIYSRYDAEAQERAKAFSHSVFRPIRYSETLEYLWWYFTKAIQLVLPVRFRWRSHYFKKAIAEMRKDHLDYVVAEGGGFEYLRYLIPEIPRDRQFLHIHHHYLPDPVVAENFDNIIGVSDFVAEEYQKAVGRPLNAAVCRNYVDTDGFSKRLTQQERQVFRSQLGILDTDFVVLFCGRFMEEKGLLELMEAVLRTGSKKIRLLIIGSACYGLRESTGYSRQVMRLAKKYPDQIRILGYIPNNALYRYYQAADLQVIPSLWEEAAGIVAIEGMLSGLPLIVTRSGGMVEYVDETCARILQRDDRLVENLTKTILELSAQEDIRRQMGTAGMKRAANFGRRQYYWNFLHAIDKTLSREGQNQKEGRL